MICDICLRDLSRKKMQHPFLVSTIGSQTTKILLILKYFVNLTIVRAGLCICSSRRGNDLCLIDLISKKKHDLISKKNMATI
jgi:hypothetical protein